MNNTSFSDDRFSDQSVKTPQENYNSTRNLHRNLQLHQKPPLLPRKTKRAKELKSSPNKSRVRSRKLHLTEQKSKRTVENAKSPNESQTNSEQWLHQHTTTQKTTKTSKNSRCGWEQVLHGPHGGRLMILPVDQNVGTCLVKLGSTCAPLQPPSFVTIHLKNLQKNRAAPLRPIALQRPSQ